MDSATVSKKETLPEATGPFQLSVCICTFNGAARLPAVLECLARQTAPREAWEILIIDNASNDATSSVATNLLKDHGFVKGKLVLEPEPGVTFARRRAALEARGDIVCFLDDDNLPDSDYVTNAIQIFSEYPKTGNVGGKIVADWEVEPTALVRAVESYALAIVDQGDEPKVYSWVSHGPVGAGMCIRRDLLCNALEDPRFCSSIPSRRGNSLTSGEDDALAVVVYQAGFERRYDPRLRLRHRLNAGRMTLQYLLRLFHGIGRGQTAVRQLWAPGGARRIVVMQVGFKDFLRWLVEAVRGPNNRKWLTHIPESVRSQSPGLRRDLHALEQSLLWGRVAAAWEYVFPRLAKTPDRHQPNSNVKSSPFP